MKSQGMTKDMSLGLNIGTKFHGIFNCQNMMSLKTKIANLIVALEEKTVDKVSRLPPLES